MVVDAHAMGNRLVGMAVDGPMMAGMALILLGVVLAGWGALPKPRLARDRQKRPRFEIAETTGLNGGHVAAMPEFGWNLVMAFLL